MKLIFVVCVIFTLQANCQPLQYTNPIIHADYSDPDAIRVGDDFYMTASSFCSVPGLPILHSKDLVNWKLIGHALPKLYPLEYYKKVHHGAGVWAPSIRYHKNEFYIFYPDPDFGIYVTKSKNILGPWSTPKMVAEGKGLIDPCPLWDDDGKVYLTHAYAGSRAGFKSIIVIKEMNAKADSIISEPVMIYDGHNDDPTIEGPKIYKRNNYYYIFAPAGGVSTGWQMVLRSKNIYGPYERKVVMQQGKTNINGPHQGAWVQTKTGEDWFLHFQDKDAYGRIVHLQPMKWKNDYPIIGVNETKDGIGEPTIKHTSPNIKLNTKSNQNLNDEFDKPTLNLNWQWQANPQEGWAFATPNGYLTMYSVLQNDSTNTSWNLPNILSQKFNAENFTATIKFNFNARWNGEKFGLIVHGLDLAYIAITKKANDNYISYSNCINAEKNNKETILLEEKLSINELFFRVKVTSGATCNFSYSDDGINYKNIGSQFIAKPGKWVGAKLGVFFNRYNKTNDAGNVNIDWLRYTN